MTDQLSSLSEVQRRCLRLVAEGKSSKEIAPIVGLSHGTVDQYLSRATVILGARNRASAASMLAKIEAGEPVQGFEFKSDEIDPLTKMGDPVETAGSSSTFLERLGLPPTGGETNDLGIQAKLFAISKIAIFVTIATMALVIFTKGAFIVLS